MDDLCRLFGKSRQAYHERQKYVYQTKVEEDVILSLVKEARNKFPRMGAKKLLIYLTPTLQRMEISIGRDAFLELLYRNFLLVKRLRNKRKTTYSNHWMRKYPNLIRNYTPISPNKLWVSDITYIETKHGFVYLSLITDAYSRKIVGWNLSKRLDSESPLKALKKALNELPEGEDKLIHHSDRGSQYCSSKYTGMLNQHKIRISMTESGDPLENAIAERVNGILKMEWLHSNPPKDYEEANKLIETIITLYNDERPHQSLAYQVPALVHETGMKTERKWKNYYQKKPIFADNCQAISGQ